jgi:hypothetical protein
MFSSFIFLIDLVGGKMSLADSGDRSTKKLPIARRRLAAHVIDVAGCQIN